MFKLLKEIFMPSIINKHDIKKMLKIALSKKVIDIDCLLMLEAVLHIDDLKVQDIMIPRNQIDTLDVHDDIDDIIKKILKTGHSRFPIINGEISQVMGIFHSKDLVSYFNAKDTFKIIDYMHEVYFVPEIKRLDNLLFEMRMKHAHLMMVVDEFTNIVGLVTLEMIIEQIIGEIEDEYDSVEGEDAITEIDNKQYRIKGYCKLHELNQHLKLNLKANNIETIGGFVIKHLSRIPNNDEIIELKNMRIKIISANTKRIDLMILYL